MLFIAIALYCLSLLRYAVYRYSGVSCSLMAKECNTENMKTVKKYNSILVLTAVICTCLTACFKDEPLNAECDIERAWVHYDAPEEYVLNLSDTIISEVYSTDKKITFYVKPGTDITRLAPQFITTEGATLTPASGTERDFSNGALVYVTTSQDGEWHKEYEVEFVERISVRPPSAPDEMEEFYEISYDFEGAFLHSDDITKTQYYRWTDQNGTEWASGNGGFAISNSSATPDEYPTVMIEDGYEGKGVKLTTCATGPIAVMVSMPMAAGNLFIGKFITETALRDALRSTQFGMPFDGKPVKFTGYYKYRPGDTFKDRYGNVENRTDEGAIYAILYKNHDAYGNPVVLYGDNVQTSEQIVAKAIMAEVKPTDEWTKYEIAFDYGGQDLEPETLEKFGYSLAVVFSSSKNGAYFQGAVGSTLYIDKVKIICEATK